MNNRALLALALLGSACIPQASALNPNDVAEAARVIDRVTRIANETQVLTPGAELEAPTPRNDTKGKFISPYRSDGELADWANRAINATAGAVVAGEATDRATGSAVNQLAGKVPGGALVGGLLKKKAKDKAKELGAVTAVGGWDYIKKTSDLSFNSADELAVYMHATHSDTDVDFAKALSAAFSVYPELKDAYEPAVRNAYAYAAARAPKVVVPPAPEVVMPAVPAVPAATAEVVVPVAVAAVSATERVEVQAVPVAAAVAVPAAPVVVAPVVAEPVVAVPAAPAATVAPTPVVARAAAPAPTVPEVPAVMLDAKKDFDWKSKALTRTNRVAVTGFRVALVIQDKVSASVAAGYQFGGTHTSGARSSTEVELHGIDAALLQELADTLYAEFVEGLVASGREVVSLDEIRATPGWSQIEPAPTDEGGVYLRKPGMGQSRHLAIVSASGLALWFEAASQIGDKGVFDQANVKAMNAVSVDLNVVVVAPTFLVTFAELEASGNKRGAFAGYAGDAKTSAKPNMSIIETETMLWSQHAKVKFAGEFYKGALKKSVLVGEYGGDMQPFSNSSNANDGLRASLTGLAGATGNSGFFAAAGPTRASQTLVVTADPEQFRERALAALRSVNSAFVQIVRENKP